MRQTPEEWLVEYNKTVKRHKREMKSLESARRQICCPSRTFLRPAKASDIKVGRVIYYPDSDDFMGWFVVTELLHYGDDWKAFEADDGCRYGLDGAFVKR